MLFGLAAHGQDRVTTRFGTLPVLQALPLYVAQEEGLFGEAGVNVELIPFNTAAEKDIAMTTGNIDGYFGDLFTPTVIKGNGVDVLIVATNYDTRADRRMFAVLAKPGGKHKSVSDLAGVPVAVSSNSVIDFVTERLLTAGGVPVGKVAKVESKNIGLRMQMLLSGQVEAATLPEPLVTAAAAKGAKIVADDKGVPQSQTVLVFSGAFARKHSNAVKAFLKAVAKANRSINERPDSVRAVMVKNVRLPGFLKASYPVPHFPQLHAPTKETFGVVVAWLVKRGVVKKPVKYEDVVDGSFLP